MKLLISQKDQLFDLIEKSGLSPSQFEFTESISRLGAKQKATTLTFKNSDYFNAVFINYWFHLFNVKCPIFSC